jgi:hypothetical protein
MAALSPSLCENQSAMAPGPASRTIGDNSNVYFVSCISQQARGGARFSTSRGDKTHANCRLGACFRRAAICKSQPANDLRAGEKTRPDKTRKTSSPSTYCRNGSRRQATNRSAEGGWGMGDGERQARIPFPTALILPYDKPAAAIRSAIAAVSGSPATSTNRHSERLRNHVPCRLANRRVRTFI